MYPKVSWNFNWRGKSQSRLKPAMSSSFPLEKYIWRGISDRPKASSSRRISSKRESHYWYVPMALRITNGTHFC